MNVTELLQENITWVDGAKMMHKAHFELFIRTLKDVFTNLTGTAVNCNKTHNYFTTHTVQKKKMVNPQYASGLVH